MGGGQFGSSLSLNLITIDFKVAFRGKTCRLVKGRLAYDVQTVSAMLIISAK
jgi:hypothetical protein